MACFLPSFVLRSMTAGRSNMSLTESRLMSLGSLSQPLMRRVSTLFLFLEQWVADWIPLCLGVFSDNCLLRLIYLLSTSGYIYLHTRLLRYSFRKSIPFCHFLILLISIPFVSVIKSCLQLEHDPHFRCFTTVVSPCVFSSYFDVDFHCFFSLFLTVFSFLLPSMQLLFLSFSNDITFGDFGIVSSSYSCPFVSLLSSCPIFFTNNTTVRATLCQLSFLPIRPHVPSLGCSIGQLPLLRCFVASPFACFARLLLSLRHLANFLNNFSSCEYFDTALLFSNDRFSIVRKSRLVAFYTSTFLADRPISIARSHITIFLHPQKLSSTSFSLILIDFAYPILLPLTANPPQHPLLWLVSKWTGWTAPITSAQCAFWVRRLFFLHAICYVIYLLFFPYGILWNLLICIYKNEKPRRSWKFDCNQVI